MERKTKITKRKTSNVAFNPLFSFLLQSASLFCIFLFLTIFHYFLLNRNAFVITETELKLIAAAAIIGLSNIPKNGNRIPAATGTPSEL